jgi:hypothetical protein
MICSGESAAKAAQAGYHAATAGLRRVGINAE